MGRVGLTPRRQGPAIKRTTSQGALGFKTSITRGVVDMSLRRNAYNDAKALKVERAQYGKRAAWGQDCTPSVIVRRGGALAHR